VDNVRFSPGPGQIGPVGLNDASFSPKHSETITFTCTLEPSP
jgi:hypothetical protein